MHSKINSNSLINFKNINLNLILNRKFSNWKSKVGLEIHAQINSTTKLFSKASATSLTSPNTTVYPFDIAAPGTLPILNKRCVEAAIQTSLALNAKINLISYFDRKHYFYPDLPSGYQITQKRIPIAQNGYIQVPALEGEKGGNEYLINIERIQLENDSAKIILNSALNNNTFLDFNRSGIGLMEIVTKPEMSSGEEASGFVRELKMIFERLSVCDGAMEEGSMRVDANVSVHIGEEMAPRVEIKNISGFRFLSKAINLEIKRQISCKERGEIILEETRMYDNENNRTYPIRGKTLSDDYRFMPEPDLPPLALYDSELELYPTGFTKTDLEENSLDIADMRRNLTELPNSTRNNLKMKYSLKSRDVETLLEDKKLMHFFIEMMKVSQPFEIEPQLAINWLQILVGEIRKIPDLNLENSGFTPLKLLEIAQLCKKGEITMIKSKQLIYIIISGDKRPPQEIVKEQQFSTIRDKIIIENALKEVCQENKDMIVKMMSRNKIKLGGILKGKVMIKLKKRGDIETIESIINKYIQNS